MIEIRENKIFEKWCANCDYRGTADLYDLDMDEYFCPICETHENFFDLEVWQELDSFYELNCPDNQEFLDCELYDNEEHQDWIIREFDKRFIGRVYQPTLPCTEYTIQEGKPVSQFPMGKMNKRD